MNYEEFIFAISECAKKKLTRWESLERQEILKNNGVVAKGISIRKQGESVVPIIYLEDYYRKYCAGENLEELAEHLINKVRCAPAAPKWEYEDILDFNKIRNRIVYKLINAKRNERLLKEVPNLPMLDFAIVFYIMISNNQAENCSVLIRNEHMNGWRLPISLLYQCARENTPKLCPYVLFPMSDFLEAYFGETIDRCPLLVLSNETGINGASALLYPHMPKIIFESIGKNYYLLPSSIHELLIVPEEKSLIAGNLKEMVQDVNASHVAKEEYLSDSIYYFDGHTITKM